MEGKKLMLGSIDENEGTYLSVIRYTLLVFKLIYFIASKSSIV